MYYLSLSGNQERLSDFEKQYKNTLLHEIDSWVTGLIKEEPFRKEWSIGTFLDAFPTFAKWKKSQDEEESKDTTVQNKAA